MTTSNADYERIHYARDDDAQPLCNAGRVGDGMSFFLSDVACAECARLLQIGGSASDTEDR